MSKKTMVRADLIGSKCKTAILSAVATLEGIKSMDINDENCTLTVVGTVDPVAIVLELKKACLAAAIVSVEDDKPKEPEPPKEDEDPCQCREACVQACVEACEKECGPGCYCSPCVLPNCCYYTALRPAPYGYGWYYW
ncbi:heavy metal-associated isoprenylated plant protein 2-like [Miscanthus floridulus]|uniref:heavy metal-associated isoprenylated plant protein 2-like n=1 Tax=Miscanthus floridulus TaxID=154761 RepID=UPI003459738D